jgi:hypothetical protein
VPCFQLTWDEYQLKEEDLLEFHVDKSRFQAELQRKEKPDYKEDTETTIQDTDFLLISIRQQQLYAIRLFVPLQDLPEAWKKIQEEKYLHLTLYN